MIEVAHIKRFKSKAAFEKYAAHIHIHHLEHHAGEKVYIAGKLHTPKKSRYDIPIGRGEVKYCRSCMTHHHIGRHKGRI